MPNLSELTGDALKNELKRRKLDTIRVHNPTEEDFLMVWDKSGAAESWLIPASDKDKGYGRGNRDVPRYIAERYVKKMVDKLITQDIDESWNELKKKYTPDQFIAHIELEASKRTTDPVERKKHIGKVWLGIIKRHGEDVVEVEEPKKKLKGFPQDQSLLEELDLDEVNYAQRIKTLKKEVSDE